MPLQYVSTDGFEGDDANEVWAELTKLWVRYVEDCEMADTKATLIDFVVWSIQIRAFVDGVSIGSDRDEPE
jgi:hypothetical protein